jgi:hypothetical protein
MNKTSAKPAVSTLLLWCIVSGLLLLTSQVVVASDSLPPEVTVQVLAALCLEPDQAAFVPRPLKDRWGSVEQGAAVPRVTPILEQKKSVRDELYIPQALLRGLLMEARDSVAELRVPDTLLAFMLAEGRVQKHKRSPAVCSSIFWPGE